MWFFLVKSILGAIIGQSTNAWFKKTKMGIWFYKKVDGWYNWAAKRYDLDILTKEEKLIKLESPNLNTSPSRAIAQIEKIIKDQQI